MALAAQNLQELREQALSLPHSTRARLAQELLESLEPENEKLDALWAEEAEHRFDEIKSGQVRALSGAQVLQRVRNRKK
jgi:putative addiction module component (TIGR02574 family)